METSKDVHVTPTVGSAVVVVVAGAVVVVVVVVVPGAEVVVVPAPGQLPGYPD
jgi:hypothetical protein